MLSHVSLSVTCVCAHNMALCDLWFIIVDVTLYYFFIGILWFSFFVLLIWFNLRCSFIQYSNIYEYDINIPSTNICTIATVRPTTLIPNTHHPSLPPQHHIQASHLIYSLLCVSHLSMTFHVSITQEQEQALTPWHGCSPS